MSKILEEQTDGQPIGSANDDPEAIGVGPHANSIASDLRIQLKCIVQQTFIYCADRSSGFGKYLTGHMRACMVAGDGLLEFVPPIEGWPMIMVLYPAAGDGTGCAA